MVRRSIDNYPGHKEDVFNSIKIKYGETYAKKFIELYSKRYDKHNRSFLDWEIAYILADDYHWVRKNNTIWYACVGPRGSGKSTFMQNSFYFLDDQFNINDTNLTIREFINRLDDLPKLKSYRGLYMDEPDIDIGPNSKEGRVLKDVIGKMRQQNVYAGICATTLTDIPSYIWKQIDVIFFLPVLGKGLMFRNRPEKGQFPLQEIRERYSKAGYNVFFELINQAFSFDTTRFTPFTEEEKSIYLNKKSKDYQESITKAKKVLGKESKEITTTKKLIHKLKGKGMKQSEIAELMGLADSTVSEHLHSV